VRGRSACSEFIQPARAAVAARRAAGELPRTYSTRPSARDRAPLHDPYNHKLWGVHPRENHGGLGARASSRADARRRHRRRRRGQPARSSATTSRSLLIRRRGIETMTRALVGSIDRSHGDIRTGVALDALDLHERTVTAGGETMSYSAVVASIPLPELLKRTKGLPADVEKLPASSAVTPVRYLNVGTRPRPRPTFHWIYVPRRNIRLPRRHYSNALPSMAPNGLGSPLTSSSPDRGPRWRPAPRATRSSATTAAASPPPAPSRRPDDVLFADPHRIQIRVRRLRRQLLSRDGADPRLPREPRILPARPLRLLDVQSPWRTVSWRGAGGRHHRQEASAAFRARSLGPTGHVQA